MMKAMMPDHRAVRGFTLLEVLIAVAISALIAALAYGFLRSAIEAKGSADEALKTVTDLETVFQLLTTDLQHVVDRNLPAAAAGLGSTEAAPAFMGGSSDARGANYLLGDYVLRFARDGWANPLQQQRSDLQRVGYRWYEGQLWREYWPERNQPLDSEPAGRRLLIEDLQAVNIRFLPLGVREVDEGSWQPVWPPDEQATGAEGESNLPLAVEVVISLEEMGDVRRIISLPGI